MSTPGNPIFLEAHKLRMERRIHTDHVYFLGPQTYMHAVTKCLVGSIIDLNPGVEVFEQLRAVVEKHPNIRTYREDLPYNSVLYRGPNEGDLWEQEKRTLYRDYNLKHWTGEW